MKRLLICIAAVALVVFAFGSRCVDSRADSAYEVDANLAVALFLEEAEVAVGRIVLRRSTEDSRFQPYVRSAETDVVVVDRDDIDAICRAIRSGAYRSDLPHPVIDRARQRRYFDMYFFFLGTPDKYVMAACHLAYDVNGVPVVLWRTHGRGDRIDGSNVPLGQVMKPLLERLD